MKTTIKKGKTEKVVLGIPKYSLYDLENEVEITTLIQEYEQSLQPCTHCGASEAAILYEYRSQASAPHIFYVGCKRFLCGIRTQEWCAVDDENNDDIRDILSLVCSWWNRRPGELEKLEREWKGYRKL